jgi:hypothetical protein
MIGMHQRWLSADKPMKVGFGSAAQADKMAARFPSQFDSEHALL